MFRQVKFLNHQHVPKEGRRRVLPDPALAISPASRDDVQSLPMEIVPDDIYRCRENLVTREIVGETIIVPISGQLADLQQVYSLNATGGFVWSHLDGSTSLEIIHKAVIASFKVRKNDAWTDLAELVSDLDEAGLIEKVPNLLEEVE